MHGCSGSSSHADPRLTAALAKGCSSSEGSRRLTLRRRLQKTSYQLQREGGDTTESPLPRLTLLSKNGRLWSIQFFLSFYIFLIPHRGAGRCFIFSYSLSLCHLPPHLFLHLPGLQFHIFMTERKELSFHFFHTISLLLPISPDPSIASFLSSNSNVMINLDEFSSDF